MKIPWKLILIGAGVLFILLLVGSLTGASQKLFNMAIDQLRDDKTRIVEIQAENQKWYEEEIQKLAEERERLRQDKTSLQSEKAQVAAERDALKGWVDELKKRREVIVVSDDPDRVIADLRKLGISSIRRPR